MSTVSSNDIDLNVGRDATDAMLKNACPEVAQP